MRKPPPFLVSPDDAPAKQEILKAALRLFVRDGLCETSIRTIAAEAGYTNPAMFKHFESKEALALHLFERCYRWLADALADAMSPARPFEAAVHALVARFAELIDESLDAFLYVQDTLRHFWPRVSPELRRHSIVGMLRKVVHAGSKEGVVTPDVSEDLLVAGIIGLLSQYARLVYFGELAGGPRELVGPLERTVLRMTCR